MEKNKYKEFSFRLTKSEFSKLNKISYELGITKSDFLRGSINNYIPNVSLNKEVLKLTKEIRRIGVNINQIAKHSNQTNKINEIYLKNYLRELDGVILAINERILDGSYKFMGN